MKIVVCYKGVPEEQDIIVKTDGTLELSAASVKIGQYDLNAIEAAVRLKENGEHEIIALTVSSEASDNTKLKKSVLSRGPDKTIGIQDSTLENMDTIQTAGVIAQAVKKIGDVNLIVFGEGSGDRYAQQVGPVTGALLGWPTVNGVQKMELDGNKLAISRCVRDGVELLETPLPAVVSVTSDINTPRIPSMKEILAAGRKPSETWTLEDLCYVDHGSSRVVNVLAPEKAERKQIIQAGDPDELAEWLYQQLRKLM